MATKEKSKEKGKSRPQNTEKHTDWVEIVKTENQAAEKEPRGIKIRAGRITVHLPYNYDIAKFAEICHKLNGLF